ncbi:MAG: phospho-N-acetylmuramoyl-pentapeptide-transferase [Chloroflexota bacterium]
MNQLVTAPLVGFLVALVLGPLLLPLLRRLKFGQVVREDGPQSHLVKKGTPTMGGILFIVGGTVAAIVAAPHSLPVVLVLATMAGNAAVGFADDYIKVVLKRPLGLRARDKLLAQLLLGLALGIIAVAYLKLPTAVAIPFTQRSIELGWLYVPLVVLMLMGASNGTNLTDGVDGLCGSVTVVALVVYALIGLAAGRADLAIVAVGLAGGMGGFLHYNLHPAKLFMGDTGSNALGGALAALAVLTKTELVLVIVGGIYVFETISDIIQVTWFKATGRRVFKMAPIHHHFELSGWSEEKIVLRFVIAAVILGIIGFWGIGGIGGGIIR